VAIINKGEIVAKGEIKKLLGEMDEETFIFSVGEAVPDQAIALLAPYAPQVTDHQLELTISREHDLNAAFSTLSQARVKVLSMRNKTNRLEEFFVQKTKAQ
jgi:ABC-2 type transport system ATP-binding protein